MALKKSLKVFTAIPNLRKGDEYGGYLGSVLNHLHAQETSVKVLEPYITTNYHGKFKPGEDSKLDAITYQMNRIVDKFMASDATHLFFNDGDVEIPPDTIDTLLRHNVDLASGVYPFKNFDSVYAMLFGRMAENKPCGNFIPRDWDHMKGRVWGEKDKWSGGSGCMLVKRRVFQRYHPNIPPLRFSRDGGCSLDTLFWKRVQDAGFTARVDARVVCGHLPEHPLNEINEWLK